MSEKNPNSQRRYRRRIVGWGAVLLVLAFVIPAFFAVRWVHSDLENRVENELADRGFSGVSATFSGQDGTLTCTEPLADSTAALSLAVEVYGVHAIDLDSSCLRTEPRDPDDGADAPESSPSTDPEDDEASDTTAPVDTSDGVESEVTTTTEQPVPQLESIVEVTNADPQFSQLADLLDTAGLLDTLNNDGPFTLLAPTDAAFDMAFEALGADEFGALTSDAERLRDVLLHHVVEGAVRSTDFVAGPIMMLDGTPIDVEPSDRGLTFTSGDSIAEVIDPAQLDIEASNGIVHAIDAVLLPVAEPVEPVVETVVTAARLENGQITLSGMLRTDEQRLTLVAAVQEQVAAGNVSDQLVVDSGVTIADADLDRLSRAIAALPPNLVSGEAALTDGVLTITGVHLGDEASAALTTVAAELAAELDIEPRADADAQTAQQLQDELNDFVRLNPILFESNSADLTPEADAVVDQVAARAQRYAGVDITIVGHTDSDGDPGRNQVLSQGRANTVLNELVARGLDATSLSAEGRGMSEPVLDADGVEDKTASRRVEFVVNARS